MVAQQTLTLYAWVRILVPLPKEERHPRGVFFLLIAELRPEPSSLLRKDWVRIPRAERVELARKRQGEKSSPTASTLVPQTIIRWSVFLSFGRGTADSHHSSRSERGTAMCRADTTHNAGYGIRIAVCAYPAQSASSSLVSGKRGYLRASHEYPSSSGNFPQTSCNPPRFYAILTIERR